MIILSFALFIVCFSVGAFTNNQKVEDGFLILSVIFGVIFIVHIISWSAPA